jgi:hypothetical protein
VTGKQILESSLAQVPSAALAQRAQSAALATAADTAQRAQSAARADRATAAGTAQLAESASKLGTLTPSDVVQGGGQSFARSTALSENTGVGPAFDIPTVGNLNLGCDTQGNLLVGELTNTTGQSVLAQETIDGVNSGGSTFGPGANIINLATSPSQGGSIQVLAVWPSVNPTHSADFTIGWYLDGVSHECTALVEGVVR